MNISSMTYAAFNAGRRSGLPLIAALVTMSAQAQTTITFDEVTGATAINNTYAGMVFSNPLNGGSIFVSSAPHFKTPPNVVTVFQTSGAFNEYWGSVQVTFSASTWPLLVPRRTGGTRVPDRTSAHTTAMALRWRRANLWVPCPSPARPRHGRR